MNAACQSTRPVIPRFVYLQLARIQLQWARDLQQAITRRAARGDDVQPFLQAYAEALASAVTWRDYARELTP